MQNLLLQGSTLCDSLPPAVQAKEFGEAEVWMNERLMRAAPRQFAEFVTAFEDRDALARRGAEPLWLVTLYPSNQSDFDRDALARRGAEPLWLVTLCPSNRFDFDRDALARRFAEPLWLATLYPSNHAACADANLHAACGMVDSDRGCRRTCGSCLLRSVAQPGNSWPMEHCPRLAGARGTRVPAHVHA